MPKYLMTVQQERVLVYEWVVEIEADCIEAAEDAATDADLLTEAASDIVMEEWTDFHVLGKEIK